MREAGDYKALDDKILAFFKAAAENPDLIEKYRTEGPEFLQAEFGFTDDEIELLKAKPAVWAMTVFPQPPIVRPPHPPTVFG
jgi:hypothetical protein